MQYLLTRKDNYFSFIKFTSKIRKYFYTTNAIESFNSMLEKVRIRNGGHFQSEKVIDINIYLLRKKLKTKKWRHSIPKLKDCAYEILQQFNLQFME